MKFKGFVLVMGLVAGSAVILQAASSGDQALGLMLGNPTGLSGKFWVSDLVALDAAFGVDQGELDLHFDLLFHDYNFIKKLNIQTSPKADFPVYIGVGPRALFDDETEIGLRLPVGLSVFPHQTPWEFFGEIAPVIRFTPSGGLDADFALGARYYFEAIRPRK